MHTLLQLQYPTVVLLRVFENMMLRRIFGLIRDEVTKDGGDCITRS